MIFFSHVASDPNRVVFSTRKVVTVPKIDSVELRENSAWPKKTGAYWEQTRRYRPDKTEVKGMLGRGGEGRIVGKRDVEEERDRGEIWGEGLEKVTTGP